jgi:putative two-component system response regulator
VHIIRIGFLAEALALLLGQSRQSAGMLRKAAPMHDIGKIGIPDKCSRSPALSSLTERATMNQHASMGADILGRSRIPLFQLAAELALSAPREVGRHGLPPRTGRRGDSRSPGRIVAVVDFFDALTMDRVYRKAFPYEKALAMLQDQRGTPLIPRIVDTFMAHAEALISAARADQPDLHPTFSDLVDGL